MAIRQIKLQKYDTEKNGSGDNQEYLHKNVATFAEVSEAGGDRVSNDGQTGMTKTMNFKIRFNPNFDITGNWRVIYDGRSYQIHTITKDKEKRFYWKLTGTSV